MKTIAQECDEFIALCFKNAPAFQVADLRKTFFAGAITCFQKVQHASEAPDDIAAVGRLNAVFAELDREITQMAHSGKRN